MYDMRPTVWVNLLLCSKVVVSSVSYHVSLHAFDPQYLWN